MVGDERVRPPGVSDGWATALQEVVLGMRDWRTRHPTATLTEIETAIDERLHRVRAQLMTEMALASTAPSVEIGERPVCSQCGGRLVGEGQHQRTVVTLGNEAVTVQRAYATCTACGWRFSPLDHELGLLPNQRFTPRVAELLARLGQAVEFSEAVALLRLAVGVQVSEATARRRTYAAGTAALAVETAERRQIEQGLPRATVRPARLQVSLDGTTVPLVGGTWTEVKVAVFGAVVDAVTTDGRPTVTATDLSYAARWEPAEQFGPTLTVEAHRRGVDEATVVVSPNDGADGIQGVLDLIAPQAVRILDEPHAAEHLGTIADLVYGAGSLAARTWVTTQRGRLQRDPVAGVLAELQRCAARGPTPDAPSGPDGLAPAAWLAREVAYFQKRAAQITYADFRQAGYPIGSGIVESGHKVVVGRRFKGAGHHWAAAHLNPLLILRTLVCNARWTTQWPAIWTEASRAVMIARHAAQRTRAAGRAVPSPARPPSTAPAVVPPVPVPRPQPLTRLKPVLRAARPPTIPGGCRRATPPPGPSPQRPNN